MAKKAKAVSTPKETKKPGYKKTIWLTIAAGFLLLITNSAIWVNRQIFNSANFTNTVTTSLTSESSREAIAQEVTDRMFEDRPIAKRIAGNFSTKLVSGVLATDQFNAVLSTAVNKLQVYATSSNQQSVEIDFTGIKDILARVSNVAESLGSQVTIDTEKIPDNIQIVNEENIPDFYRAGVVMSWLAPITFIIALLLLAYPYRKKLNLSRRLLTLQGSIITLVGIFALLLGPLFKPPVLSTIDKQTSRTVVGNLYDAFIATFNTQTYYMIGFGLLMILAGVIWYAIPSIKKFANSKLSK